MSKKRKAYIETVDREVLELSSPAPGACARSLRSRSWIAANNLQRRAVELVLDGQNIFLTGSGGVGKSYATDLIVQALQETYGEAMQRRVAVCASTGIAATHINGSTVHSSTGCGVCHYVQDFARMFGKKVNVPDADPIPVICALDVLLIDEVSMISGEFLDAFEAQCSELRRYRYKGGSSKCNPDLPFGGLQLVFIGDFFQLPPIEGKGGRNLSIGNKPGDITIQNNRAYVRRRGGQGQDPPGPELFLNRGFAFQSRAWWKTGFHFIELTQVYRQDSKELICNLDKIRWGKHDEPALNYFNRRVERQQGGRVGDYMQLVPTNKEVDRINDLEMTKLPSEFTRWKAEDFVEIFEDETGHMCPQQVRHEIENDPFFSDKGCLATNEVPNSSSTSPKYTLMD
jgi:hypothetical protein